ncbi:MAG TPA: polysaccharide deacetylase family protein [Flavisolibacter sp.]
MESSDDDGDAHTAAFTRMLFVLVLLFPALQKKTTDFKPPVIRTVFAEKPPALPTPPVVQKKKAPVKKKKVYITFDDGPNKGTKNVYHIVRDEQVPVTFFIVGEHVFASVGQSRMWDSLKMAEQIAICNHSYTHANGRYEKFYNDPEAVVDDFRRAQDSLQFDNAIIRTPGRNIWRIDSLKFTDIRKSTAAADSLQKAGFVIMGWDLEWHFDHKTMRVTSTGAKMVESIDSIFRTNRTRSPGHLVLLAHDQAYVQSGDSLELRQFLQLLKQKDEYEVCLATAYPGVSRPLADSVVVPQ